LALTLAPAFLVLAAAAAVAAWLEWKRFLGTDGGAVAALEASNPLELATAFLFAIAFFAISVITGWIQARFRAGGVVALSFAAGLVDIDPFVINLAQGNVPGLGAGAVAASVLIAASANNLAKAAYAAAFGGFRPALKPVAVLLVLAGLGFAAALWMWVRG